MKLGFIGADHEVTGSCHYLEANGIHMLIDCGMEQGTDVYENQEIPVNISDVDYILLTHAHIDHTGLLPLMYARGFRGEVYTTKATVDLCKIMLKDSAHIQMFEAEWQNRKAKRSGGEAYTPLYDMEDALGAIRLLRSCEYNEILELDQGIRVRFSDVGHLLGSASIEIWLEENHISQKIVFSGDIGNTNQPLIKDPQYLDHADYVVMESTYGDRYHTVVTDYVTELAKVINETFERGGNLVIPAFAVGRTQEILYFLRKIKEEHLVNEQFGDFPVFVDSPLAIEATGIFERNEYECFDEAAMKLIEQGINPLHFHGLNMAITSDESRAINFDSRPKIILSASGMCEAGRIRHHLKHNLWRRDSTVLFVGYQANGTLGRMLVDGAKEVKLFGETIEVRARIRKLDGISGHADKNGLIKWIGAFSEKPKKVFIVHGEDQVCDSFCDCLRSEYGYQAVAPYSGAMYDLLTGDCIREGVRRKKPVPKKPATGVYARLLAAGQRLLTVIRHNEGGANKDLAKLADQINSLCDKWDR